MVTKLKGMSKWETITVGQDGIALAQLIRNTLYKKDKSTVNITQVCNAYRDLHSCF